MKNIQNDTSKKPAINLGRQVDIFPIRRLKTFRWGSLALIGINTITSIAILITGLLTTYDRYYKNGPSVVLKNIWLPTLLAFVLFGLALWITWQAYQNWDKAVIIYEDGFIFRDFHGNHIWTWDDVTQITVDIARWKGNPLSKGTRHLFKLQKRDGSRLTLDDQLERVEVLAARIRDCTIPQLIVWGLSAFHTGDCLTFGPIRVGFSEGIYLAEGRSDWEQLKGIWIDQGLVKFILDIPDKGKNHEIRIPVNKIPNLDVLLSIIESKVGKETVLTLD